MIVLPSVHRVSAAPTCSRCGCKGGCNVLDRLIDDDSIRVCRTCVAVFTAAAAEPWFLPAAELSALEDAHREHYRLVRFSIEGQRQGMEPMRWIEGQG